MPGWGVSFGAKELFAIWGSGVVWSLGFPCKGPADDPYFVFLYTVPTNGRLCVNELVSLVTQKTPRSSPRVKGPP